MTRITVAINAYNGMPYLIEAVESILNQTMQDFILFIVNDGSTDGTAEYLKKLTDPRIRVLDQENSGTAASSNRAISECKTEFIVRMDADDISLPTRLECLLKFMDANPAAGMAGSQAVWFSEHGTGNSLKLPTRHDDIWSALMGGYHAMVHATLIMRTEVIRRAGGYWQFRHYDDDTDMMLRMGETAKLANIDKVLYHYRILAGSLSGAGLKRVRFSYDYSIELARRRASGLTPLTPEAFEASLRARPWWIRMCDAVEFHGRVQYRKAVQEIFNEKPMFGRLRLGWASICAPRLTYRRVLRIMRPVVHID
jgi:glycosyltransferase involved in cell wall biosynthesis